MLKQTKPGRLFYADPTHPAHQAKTERQKHVLKAVTDALEHRHAMLAFQPIYSVSNPNRPAFFEGLFRAMDRTGEIIPAAEFIDLVEAHEIGRRIDCLALELGLKTLIQEPGLRLSINMSPRSIGYAPWLDLLKSSLSMDATLGERLILEITEQSAVTMPLEVHRFMTDMQRLGVTFALDDFGAGFTAFRYLRDLYFDVLKIDRCFVSGIHRSPDNQVMVDALLSVARHFDMFTVAEGVENAEEAEYLTGMGVDCLQGYHLGKPTITPEWIRRPEPALAAG
ncbi:MAG: EAL domain-containing protein [Paracoccaceae bacterium]|nr:EAL domain-containing protein [Paracoccaceae bacterium]